jgi:hypothetical protein
MGHACFARDICMPAGVLYDIPWGLYMVAYIGSYG